MVGNLSSFSVFSIEILPRSLMALETRTLVQFLPFALTRDIVLSNEFDLAALVADPSACRIDDGQKAPTYLLNRLFYFLLQT